MKRLVCKVCGYVALYGNKEQCPACQAKNVFEGKEDAYKMLDFKVVSGETEKEYIFSFMLARECGLISGTGCMDVHVKIGEFFIPFCLNTI
jgi:superoxide reductase